MKPIRPYRINVYNRITDDHFAEYWSNQVPARGDQISVYPSSRNPENPFNLWGRWVVDAVVWNVADRGSQTAIEVAREADGYPGDAYYEWVDLHVWPAEGPHWTKTPPFAKILSPQDDDETEADDHV